MEHNLNQLVLLPGPDRLTDQIVARDEVRLKILDPSQSPTGRGCVLVQSDGSEDAFYPFVIPIVRAEEENFKEFSHSRGFLALGESTPMDVHEPLSRSGFYVATQDNLIHCIQKTIHRGTEIGCSQVHPLRVENDMKCEAPDQASRSRG